MENVSNSIKIYLNSEVGKNVDDYYSVIRMEENICRKKNDLDAILSFSTIIAKIFASQNRVDSFLRLGLFCMT